MAKKGKRGGKPLPQNPVEGRQKTPPMQRIPQSTQNRIYRRKAAALRARRRKRALIVFYIFTFVMVISAALTLALTVLFQIDEIQVTGQSRYSPQQIIDLCGIQIGDNLFLAKTDEAEKKIEEGLPYIGKAEVSRHLPAKIILNVEEATIAGVVQSEDSYVVVSSTGKVLEKSETQLQGYPLVKGLPISSAEPGKQIVYADENMERYFNNLVKALEQNGMHKVTQMDFTDPYQIVLKYDDRIDMNFGLPSDFDYKIRFAQSVLAQEGMDTAQGVLDLSNVVEDDRAYFDKDGILEESVSTTESSSQSASTPDSAPEESSNSSSN